MYPLDQGSWGPTVRISHLRDKLEQLVDLDLVAGYRGARRWALIGYALSGRLRGLRGIYVENSSSLPSETDIAFLALARMLRIPVLTYVRDAQYLFPEYYHGGGLKRRVARALFMPAIRLLRGVSSMVGYPSAGLAEAVGEKSPAPILLPPGSPPPVEVPLGSDARSLLFVGPMRYAAHGLDLLVDSVERVRAMGHPVDVICVSRPGEEPPEPRPDWLRVEHTSGQGIHLLLPSVIACVTPRLRSPYNDLAVPIKVMEYLSYGRPLVVTDCTEQARIVHEADCGLVAEDSADAFAAAIATLFDAPIDQINGWSANARAAAVEASWGSRASSIVRMLARGESR